MEKADHVSPSSAATHAPLAGMRKTSDPCLHFSWTGGKGQCVSDLCNCDRCLHPGRAKSLTSGCQDRFASVPLLIPPASEQLPVTILVEEGPSLPLIKPQSTNTYSPCSKLGQSVYLTKSKWLKKTGIVNWACHWFQHWSHAVSLVSGTGGSVQCPAGRLQLPVPVLCLQMPAHFGSVVPCECGIL